MIKNKIVSLKVVVTSFLIFVLLGCSQKKTDTAVKADLLTKAKSEKDFAGVRFIVENGVVTISGECPSEKSKSTVESTVKGVYGVKNVINTITIAPVVIGTDHLLKQGVDSVLKKYATVQAIVQDSIITLEGKLDNKEAQQLTTAIQSLKPRAVEMKMTVQ